MNSNGSGDSGQDQFPQITEDGQGNWISVWQSNEDLSGAGSADYDVFVSRSADSGATWTAPQLLDSNATTDSGNDSFPQVSVNSDGYYVAVWESNEDASGAVSDGNIFHALFRPPAIFVDDDNTGAEDGLTWGTPYNTIQEGIDAAVALGGAVEVWVAEGTYTDTTDPVVTMAENIHIYGGFNGTETLLTQRNWTANITIIDGENARRGVTGANNTTLDGFTVTRGDTAGNGGGMSGSGMLVTNCTFLENSAYFGAGGGVSGSGTFTNCTFLGNAAVFGAGVHGSGTFTNCTFTENVAIGLGKGGGMYTDVASPVLTNCVFTRNSGSSGGGMYNHESSPILMNCTFTGNSASNGNGGGMNNYESSPILMNCTFTGNSVSNGNGGGMNNHESSPTLTNCIIWGNSSSVYDDLGTSIITYSIIEGGHAGTGNIDDDPLFWDLDNGDSRISIRSPAIDSGTATGAPSTDIVGNPRPVDIPGIGTEGAGAVDMGAHEMLPVAHVDASNSGSKDGLTWATAFNTIQEGVDAADALGVTVEVWVAAGTYTDTADQVVAMAEDVHLYGGVSTTENGRFVRNLIVNATIIDGENTRRGVIGANNATLDGFTITRGYTSSDGGGMYNSSTSPAVTNVTFYNNTADNAGGGMFNTSASPILTNSIFDRNISGNDGGGMYNVSASPVITNGTFSGNSASNSGGAIYNSSSSPTITNNILWGNTPTSIENVNGSTPVTTYSIVEGDGSGNGNIDADPLFIDEANGDVRLTYNSPAIDSGTIIGAPSKDILGNPRPVDFIGIGTEGPGAVDMGVFERQAVIFVDKDNAGAEDGFSWATAFNTIQEGIDRSFLMGGGEVWVAEGTYTSAADPVVAMEQKVHLYGGFNGTEFVRTQRDWTTYLSVIDGENARRGVTGSSNATLDGFTITRGYSGEEGGGMKNSYVTRLSVTNCTFIDNASSSDGGGAHSQSSSVQWLNCF